MRSGLLSGVLCVALVVVFVFFKGAHVPAPSPDDDGAVVSSEVRPPLSLPPDEGAWMIVSIVGGGFDGKGMGIVAANSAGEVVAAPPAEPDSVRFSCKTQPGGEEVHELARVVSAARGQEWAGKYVDPQNPDGCCDQFGYKLELQRRPPGGGKQVYAASWYEGSARLLPENLRALQAIVERVKAKAFDGCEGMPAAR